VKLLLAEDSTRLRKTLERAFRYEGYLVDATGDGEEALWYGFNHVYDVVVLDIMLPSRDGLSVLAAWRAKGMVVPVLLLSARSSVPDRVRGLRDGADDYLIKPFALEELLERVRVLARRQTPQCSERYSLGPLSIDLRRRQASCAGEVIPLTPKEYRLLELLCRNAGKVMSRSEIEACILDTHAEPVSNVVDVTVAGVRRKLRQFGSADLLQTRRGLGYLIEAP